MSNNLRHIKRFCQDVFRDLIPHREKPIVIQMPITSRCNSRCVTCNVWKQQIKTDIDASLLKKRLKDPFFSEVKSVGLNGGEFSLVYGFKEILDALTSLPKLEDIYLISNGLAIQRIKEYSQYAMEFFSEKGVRVSLCISIDGVGITHDRIRGINGSFDRSIQLIKEIQEHKQKYCNNLTIGHTLSRFNIDKIYESENDLSRFNIPLDIHLAVPNKRIGTYNDSARYDIISDETSRQLAAEYFFSKFLETDDYRMKSRYFANYYYLSHHGKGRLTNCYYRFRDVTIDENLNLILCATAGEPLGNLREKSASAIAYSKETQAEVRRVLKECDHCIHYSYYPLTIKGRFLFAQEVVKQRYSNNTYKVLCGSLSSLIASIVYFKRVLRIVVKYDY